MALEPPNDPTSLVREPSLAREENISSLPTPERSPTPPSKTAELTRRAQQNPRPARNTDNDGSFKRGQLRPNGEIGYAIDCTPAEQAVRQAEVPPVAVAQDDQQKTNASKSSSKQGLKKSASDRSDNASLARTNDASKDPRQPLSTKPPRAEQKPVAGPSSAATSRHVSLPRQDEPANLSRQAETSTRTKKRASMDDSSHEDDGQRNGSKKQRRDNSKPLNSAVAVAGPSKEPAARVSLDADKGPIQSEQRDGRKKKKKKRHDKTKAGAKSSSTAAAAAAAVEVPTLPVPPAPAKIEAHPPAKLLSKNGKKKEAAKADLRMQAGYTCPQVRTFSVSLLCFSSLTFI